MYFIARVSNPLQLFLISGSIFLLAVAGCSSQQEISLVGQWRLAKPTIHENPPMKLGFDLRADQSLKTYGMTRQEAEPLDSGETLIYTIDIDGIGGGEWARAENDLILIFPTSPDKKTWATQSMKIRALSPNFLVLVDGPSAGVYRRHKD